MQSLLPPCVTACMKWVARFRPRADCQQSSRRAAASWRPGHATGRAVSQGHVRRRSAVAKDALPATGRANTQASATFQAEDRQDRSHSVVGSQSASCTCAYIFMLSNIVFHNYMWMHLHAYSTESILCPLNHHYLVWSSCLVWKKKAINNRLSYFGQSLSNLSLSL